MGLGGVVAILLAIALVSSGREDVDVHDVVAEAIAGAEDKISVLESKIGQLESSLNEVTKTATTSAKAEELASLVSRVEDLGGLREDINALSEKSASVTGEISGIHDRIAQTEAALEKAIQSAEVAAMAMVRPSEPAEADTAPASDNEAGADTTASDAIATTASNAVSNGFKPGETAIFDDGALAVFVSRLIPDSGQAVVSIGQETKTLTAGSGLVLPVGDSHCKLLLDSVSADGATLSAICGDALPAPEGYVAGGTALLKEGAIRVFISLVGEEAARLSINGSMVSLPVRRSTPVSVGEDECRVRVDDIDRGHVRVSAACGSEISVSNAVTAGNTVILGDGSARIFVGSVTEGGKVRFAVNGQNLSTGSSGDSFDIGSTCSVVIEDVSDGAASFSYECSE
jgi:BMFP domain-containing protein YqiC